MKKYRILLLVILCFVLFSIFSVICYMNHEFNNNENIDNEVREIINEKMSERRDNNG